MKILLVIIFILKISTLLAIEVEFDNTSCTGSEVIKVNICENRKDTFWVEIFFNRPMNDIFVSLSSFARFKVYYTYFQTK
jgi:hypothetical protein